MLSSWHLQGMKRISREYMQTLDMRFMGILPPNHDLAHAQRVWPAPHRC